MAARVVLLTLLVSIVLGCAGDAAPSVAPSSTLTPTFGPPPSATAELSPSSEEPTEPPPSPGCDGGLPTPTPRPTGVAIVRAVFITCADWQSTLTPVVRAVNKDKKNFASSYFSGPDIQTLTIFFVAGGDEKARAKVEALIPDGAPVEWRTVKYSWRDLAQLQDGPLFREIGDLFGSKVFSTAIDAKSNAIVVTTIGAQSELEQRLSRKFGDEVRVVEGPNSLPSPI